MISCASIRPVTDNEIHEQGPESGKPGLPSRGTTAKLTIVLFVQTLEHQPQFFLMILEVMYKLFKVQLPIKVLVTCLHNFLENQSKGVRFCSLASCHSREITDLHNDP